MSAKKIILGILLTLVVLSASVYYLYGDDVKVSIEKTRTKYYINSNDSWVLAATEYVNLYDGSSKMRAKSRELKSWNDSKMAYTQRTSIWKDDITTIQTYTFSKDSKDVEQFPLKNEFQCLNCENKIVHYEIRDITYDGETKQIKSPFSFGNRMKIEWGEGNYYSKVFQQIVSDKIIIKYRPQNNDEIYSVRLFDPPTTYYVNKSGSDTNNGNSTQPFLTIAKGILDATDGDTIIVSDGRYYEIENAGTDSLYINEDLTIRSENKYGAHISVNDTDGDANIDKVFYLNSNNIVIDGFIINATGQDVAKGEDCVFLRRTANFVNITNNKFYDCTSNAIELEGNGADNSDNILIENNSFYTKDTSVQIKLNYGYSSNVTIKNNLFDLVNSGSSHYGINSASLGSITNGVNLLIENNNFTSTGQLIYHYGIGLQCTMEGACHDGAVIYNNNFGTESNPFDGFHIFVSNISNINITSNHFFSDGLVYSSSEIIRQDNLAANMTVENNYFGSATFPIEGNFALDAEDCEGVSVKGNIIYMNDSRAISVESNHRNCVNTIAENNIINGTSNSGYGVKLGDEGVMPFTMTNATIRNNIALFPQYDGGGTHGILLGYTINSSVYNNSIIGGAYGFVIKGNDYANVYDNTAYNNSYYNFYDKAGLSCLFYENYGYQQISGYDSVFMAGWNSLDSRWAINSTWKDNSFNKVSGVDAFYAGINSSSVLINMTYDIADETVVDSANLTRQWYLDASSNIASTNLTLSNLVSQLYSVLSPNFLTQTLTAYTNIGGTTTNTTYTLNATAVGNASQIETFNLTENKRFVFYSCSFLGINQDWEIDMSDYCNISSIHDIGTGKLKFMGSGTTRINSTITTANLGDPGENGILEILNNCRINIK